MSDNVNHPKHYNTIDGIECLDVAENFNFNLGNALKYIWRSSFKGKQIEDLRKAVFYVNREIERLEKCVPLVDDRKVDNGEVDYTKSYCMDCNKNLEYYDGWHCHCEKGASTNYVFHGDMWNIKNNE